MVTVLALAAGGAIGTVLRYYLNMAIMMISGMSFPVGTIMINVLGSLIMGVLAGFFAHVAEPSQTLRAFLTIGILGGFTTFSAFSLDTISLWQSGEFAPAVLYVLSSVVFSLAALVLGLWMVKVLSV